MPMPIMTKMMMILGTCGGNTASHQYQYHQQGCDVRLSPCVQPSFIELLTKHIVRVMPPQLHRVTGLPAQPQTPIYEGYYYVYSLNSSRGNHLLFLFIANFLLSPSFYLSGSTLFLRLKKTNASQERHLKGKKQTHLDSKTQNGDKLEATHRRDSSAILSLEAEISLWPLWKTIGEDNYCVS